MVKKKSANKKSVKKDNVKKNYTSSKKRVAIIVPNDSNYKKGLLEVNKQENKYDKLFEQKLSEQYREFRNLKEHHMQSKKFFRIVMILIVIVLIALFLLSYRV